MTESTSTSLLRAMRILKRFVSGEISALEFLEDYSNFFYYEALDGHERSSASGDREKYWIAIDLHRRIQYEVVNITYPHNDLSKDQLREAGRIDEIEARERARAICADKGLDAIMEILGD